MVNFAKNPQGRQEIRLWQRKYLAYIILIHKEARM